MDAFSVWEEQQLKPILEVLNSDKRGIPGEPMTGRLKRLQEEDAAHIQELSAVLQPLYDTRLRFHQGIRRVEAVVGEERLAYDRFRAELHEAQNELRRIEALTQTQVFSSEDLNLFMAYRRRLLSRMEQAVLGFGLSNRCLRHSAVIRDKLEVSLARTNTLILAYERARSDYIAHHGQVCLEYAVSPTLEKVVGVSNPARICAEAQAVDEQLTRVMEGEVGEVVSALSGWAFVGGESQEKRLEMVKSLEEDVSAALQEDVEEAHLLRRP